MPGKINPTQCEAMAMATTQVMGNDVAIGIGGANSSLQMNVAKPLIISNLMQSINILSDSCENFTRYLIIGCTPNEEKIQYYLQHSLMLVTALSPVIGYDKSSQAAHYAHSNNLTLKEACLKLKLIDEEAFDKIVDPKKMIKPSN